MQANGGLATPAQTVPIFTVESGPAAGVVGSAYLARQLGIANAIATDVGGTTFKVAIIEGGHWAYAKETVLNQYQLRLPMVDVVSIGAGGGSIAWIDNGRLRVGPKSAAADPGPGLLWAWRHRADGDGCRRRARLHIDRTAFSAAACSCSFDRALRRHPVRRIAEPLFGGDVMAAAAGIRRVVDARWPISSASPRCSAATTRATSP